MVGLLFAALTSTGSAAGAIERVSVVGADLAPIGNSRSHVLSGDGRYVAFVAGSPDALGGRMCYQLAQPDGSPLPDVRRPVQVENAFGTFVIRAHEAELLCRAAAVTRRDGFRIPPLVPQGHDGMLCYETHASDVNRAMSSVTDQFGQVSTVAVTPVRLCNPLREGGVSSQLPNRYLVCYEIPPVESGGIPLSVYDVYGYLVVSTADARQVCLPSTMQPMP